MTSKPKLRYKNNHLQLFDVNFSFLKKLDSILEGEMAVTLVLDDPAGNSYVQCIGDDYAQDENLKISKYERSFEQNEEMGLNDMKVENYEKNEEKQSLETITE